MFRQELTQAELEAALLKEAENSARLILEMPEDDISGHMGVEPSRKAKKLIRKLEDKFSVEAKEIFIAEIKRILRTHEYIVFIQLVNFY